MVYLYCCHCEFVSKSLPKRPMSLRMALPPPPLHKLEEGLADGAQAEELGMDVVQAHPLGFGGVVHGVERAEVAHVAGKKASNVGTSRPE